MKAFYDRKPSVLEAVGNGSYLYRWGIKEESVQVEGFGDEPQEERKQWSCDEVTVWPPVTANVITDRVIGELWSNNHEQKLVNEYNAAQLGLYDDAVASAKIAAYKSFLMERASVKATVDSDCASLLPL